MIRIGIEWDFISPMLQVMSGILTIEKIPPYTGPEVILCFKVKKDKSSLSYESLDGNGIPCVLFDLFKDQIDIMVRGYYDGMRLKYNQYGWVDDSADIDYDKWLTKKGVEQSSIDGEVIYNKVDSEHLKNWDRSPRKVKTYDIDKTN